MKLSTLSEADVSRRDFLKKAGASTLLPSLVGAGVAPSMAKSWVGPNAPRIFLSMIPYGHEVGMEMSDLEETQGDALNSAINAYNAVKKIAGRNAEIVWGANDSEETFSVGTYITPEQAAEIMNKSAGHDNYGRSIGDLPKFHIIDDNDKHSSYYKPEFENTGNFLKGWWKEWGQGGMSPIEDKLFNTLKSHGIDPTIKPDWSIEQIEGLAAENPELYGDPEKYGLDPDHYEKWDQDPDQPKQEPEDIDVPGDYRLASPMHQPFEQRLNMALALLEARESKLSQGSLNRKANQTYNKLVEVGEIEINSDGIPYHTQEAIDLIIKALQDLYRNRPEHGPNPEEKYDSPLTLALEQIAKMIQDGWCPKWRKMAGMCGNLKPKVWPRAY